MILYLIIPVFFLLTINVEYTTEFKVGWNRRLEKCHKGKGVVKYVTPASHLDEKTLAPIAKSPAKNFWPYRMCESRNGTIFWTQHHLDKTKTCERTPLRKLKLLQDHHEELVLAQLTPECDFTSKYQKMLTHLDVNLAPQVKQIAEGNWEELEKYLQNLVNDGTYRELKIYTGTIGSRYKFDKETNVPEYFFKVVEFSPDNVTVFVGANNLLNEQRIICEDVIRGCGWSDSKKGRIYCCEFGEDMKNLLGVDSSYL